MTPARRPTSVTLALLLLAVAGGCGSSTEPAAGAANPTRAAALPAAAIAPAAADTLRLAIEDSPLAAWQAELLDLAFGAASAMPVQPHIKNRSRAQEEVVAAALELDQPRRALGYVEKIGNWRRGAGYADLALYCARHAAVSDVQPCMDLARKVAEAGGEDSQDWQRDRILVTIAQAHVALGQESQATELDSGVAASEAGKVDTARAMTIDASGFDEQLAGVQAIVAAGNFDQIRTALETCAQLFDRFYADAERRARVEAEVASATARIPFRVRIELAIEMAGFATDHADPTKALQLLDGARALLDGGQWTAQDRITLLARLAEARHGAGKPAEARTEADAALALFGARRSDIVDIDRAGVLRPIAEALQAMGDTAAARAVYAKALEEGVVNPNSRPRADDLVATACSLAVHGVEPDAALLKRLHEVRDNLRDPW